MTSARKIERIVLCPSCFGEVDLVTNSCHYCGAEFEEYIEEACRRQATVIDRKKDLGRVISITAVIFSLSLIMISLMLNHLHNMVQPVASNFTIYMIPIIAVILISAYLYELNEMRKVRGERVSQNRRIAPFALLAISIVAAIMLGLAEFVDPILNSSSILLYAILAIVFLTGILLYVKSEQGSKGQIRKASKF